MPAGSGAVLHISCSQVRAMVRWLLPTDVSGDSAPLVRPALGRTILWAPRRHGHQYHRASRPVARYSGVPPVVLQAASRCLEATVLGSAVYLRLAGTDSYVVHRVGFAPGAVRQTVYVWRARLPVIQSRALYPFEFVLCGNRCISCGGCDSGCPPASCRMGSHSNLGGSACGVVAVGALSQVRVAVDV